MSNFELPPVSGFDLSNPMRALLGRESMEQDPMRIAPQGPDGVGPLPGATPGTSSPGGFEALLTNSISSVNALQSDVREKTRGLALGEDVEVHDVMLAASKSEVAFNLMLEVRNKLIDAWEKLSRSAV